MRGLEFLEEDEDRPIGKAKKASNKEPIKKANHKHEYKEVKVIKDGFNNITWEKVFMQCVFCGKEKQETRHN
jgi:hypothetical protein